jgi:hypothetical protein
VNYLKDLNYDNVKDNSSNNKESLAIQPLLHTKKRRKNLIRTRDYQNPSEIIIMKKKILKSEMKEKSGKMNLRFKLETN